MSREAKRIGALMCDPEVVLAVSVDRKHVRFHSGSRHLRFFRQIVATQRSNEHEVRSNLSSGVAASSNHEANSRVNDSVRGYYVD